MKKKISILLQIGFGLALLLECVALYKSRFHYYDFARLLTSIILLIYVFKRKELKFIRLYFYIGLSFTVLADILTLFFFDVWFYIGISLFTFSYLSFAAIFFRYRQIKERKNIPTVLPLLAVLLTILLALYYYIPGVRDTITMIQCAVHVIVLGIILVWSFKGNRRTKGKNPYFFPAAIGIVLANIAYAVDVNLINRKYVLLDVLVVLLHGTYLLLLANAVNTYKKTEEPEAVKHHSESRHRHRHR